MSDLYIFRNAIQDILRLRKMIIVAAIAVLPMIIALVIRSFAPTAHYNASVVYNRLSESMVFGFIIVILACVYGTNIVSQEVEQKTIVYLLTRPTPRWRILMMKFAASFLATVLASSIALFLLLIATFGISEWGKSGIGRDLLIIPVASLAYGSIFMLLSTVFNKPLIAGLIYAFGIESWLPNMPGNFKMLSLMAYIRTLCHHTVQDDTAAQTADNMLAAAFATPDLTIRLSWIVVTCVILFGIFTSIEVFSNKEYIPRDDG